jgi:hypothetical protein
LVIRSACAGSREVVGGAAVHPRRQRARDGVDVQRLAGGDLLLDGRRDGPDLTL